MKFLANVDFEIIVNCQLCYTFEKFNRFDENKITSNEKRSMDNKQMDIM